MMVKLKNHVQICWEKIPLKIGIRTLLQVKLGVWATIRVQLELLKEFRQRPYSQFNGYKTSKPNQTPKLSGSKKPDLGLPSPLCL